MAAFMLLSSWNTLTAADALFVQDSTSKIYAPENRPDFGRAHRAALVLAYCF
ncbi:MAG: hypothetical protein MJY91_09030 [Bacteroidales bacterium]|nr:hypothetical protein [Bacteroidales bacterium]